MKRKLLVVDTETAGLNASTASILSLGAVIYQDGAVCGEFYTLIREHELSFPVEATPKSALEVNGIKVADLLAAPSPWEVVHRFVQWLMENELYGQQLLVGHKIEFDVSFMRRLWKEAGQDFEKQFGHRFMCTQSTAILMDWMGRMSLNGQSPSLDNVAGLLGCKRVSEVHNALEDARLTAKVLAAQIRKLSG
jgi:DNA polymerase-3 subunit epsilon